jgi:hypothetical protein
VEAFHKHIGIDGNSIRALASYFRHHEEMLHANGLGNRASNRSGVMLIHVTRHAQYFGTIHGRRTIGSNSDQRERLRLNNVMGNVQTLGWL